MSVPALVEAGKLPQYATHLPLLAACAARTTGPVLELGSGVYSTSVLHAICVPQGRPVVTLDNEEEWLDRFRGYAIKSGHLHQVLAIPGDWPATPIESPRAFDIDAEQWSVVLVDQSPPKARAQTLARIKGHAEMIVCHDSEHRVYDYEPVLATFKHRVEWQRYQPWATVVSDMLKLDWLGSLL